MRPADPSPFVPGSGRVPDVWAGRQAELADAEVALRRRVQGIYDRGRVVLGEYGIGKSVLVNRVAQDAADAGHWVADPVRIPLGSDPVPLLAEVLHDLVGRRRLDDRIGRSAAGLLERIAEVSLPVVGGGVRLQSGSSDPLAYRDVQRLLTHVGLLAREEGKAVLLRIDEVQNADTAGLSRLLTVLGDVLEDTVQESDPTGRSHTRHLPVAVWLSGLPDFRERVAEAGGTFARRFRTVELDYLDEVELRTALAPFTTDGWEVLGPDGPVRVFMEDAAVDHIVTICHGDPFLFQLAGEAAWQAGDGEVITGEEAQRGWRLVRREVQGYVEGRLTGVSELQMDYLRSAAALEDEARTGDAVAVAMGRGSAKDVASTAQSLDRTHRLIRREAGMVRFRSAAVRAWLAGGWP